MTQGGEKALDGSLSKMPVKRSLLLQREIEARGSIGSRERSRRRPVPWDCVRRQIDCNTCGGHGLPDKVVLTAGRTGEGVRKRLRRRYQLFRLER